MSKPAMGAVVRYCGHKGTFTADIWKAGGVNIVHASNSVTMDNLDRDEASYRTATHQLVDFPLCGFWKPALGVFVVPEAQVRELKNGRL